MYHAFSSLFPACLDFLSMLDGAKEAIDSTGAMFTREQTAKELGHKVGLYRDEWIWGTTTGSASSSYASVHCCFLNKHWNLKAECVDQVQFRQLVKRKGGRGVRGWAEGRKRGWREIQTGMCAQSAVFMDRKWTDLPSPQQGFFAWRSKSAEAVLTSVQISMLAPAEML